MESGASLFQLVRLKWICAQLYNHVLNVCRLYDVMPHQEITENKNLALSNVVVTKHFIARVS